mmetsp:Transcript_6450/g.23072  ORF Transcript_6450/g.23072 Transcript_6450/m.23072 type:complete len:373 (-) Transcript_6450:234-1352(-)
MVLEAGHELALEVPHLDLTVPEGEEEVVLVQEDEGVWVHELRVGDLDARPGAHVGYPQVLLLLLHQKLLVELLHKVHGPARQQVVLELLEDIPVLHRQDFQRDMVLALVVVDEQKNSGRHLELAHCGVADVVKQLVVLQVKNLVHVLVRVVRENLAVDVVELDESRPLQGLLLKERHAALLGLAPPDELQRGAPALEGRVVVRRVDADRDEGLVVLVVEQAPNDLVVLDVQVAQALIRLPAEGSADPGVRQREDHALGPHDLHHPAPLPQEAELPPPVLPRVVRVEHLLHPHALKLLAARPLHEPAVPRVAQLPPQNLVKRVRAQSALPLAQPLLLLLPLFEVQAKPLALVIVLAVRNPLLRQGGSSPLARA